VREEIMHRIVEEDAWIAVVGSLFSFPHTRVFKEE
jgi:hypothetical protein